MKRGFLNLALFMAIAGLVYWALSSAEHLDVAPGVAKAVETVRGFNREHPQVTLLLFCCAHLLAATFCVPGGCTVLNISAGAVFGFWQGCAIVYVLTMLSACIGYAAGTKLGSVPWLRKFRPLAQSLLHKSRDQDYFYFVSLRLSPLLPFGLLNLMMGALAIPFGLFFTTTFVGIFFDVVLLNNIGAAALNRSWVFAISFALLFVALFLVRKAIPKRVLAES